MGPPRVALVGAGGVGGVVAASLALARRCQFTVVARGAALDTLQRAGLEVELDDGRRVTATPDLLTAVDPANTAAVGPQDYVVVATKAHQLAGASLSGSNFHRFDRFELDLCGHTHVRGAALSCLRLKSADIVLI